MRKEIVKCFKEKSVFKLYALVLFTLVWNELKTQTNQAGSWFIYFGNQPINKNFNWTNEFQFRYNDLGSDLGQRLLRTGIGYNLTENNNNLSLGYANISTKSVVDNKETSILEHRIYQQFITKQNFNRVYLLHRYRVEERFIEKDFLMRFRYFLSFNIPINTKKMDAKSLYLSAYNEIFISNQQPLFDRNRLYGALGYCINKNFRIELGYMTQPREQTTTNQLQFVVFNNIPYLQKHNN